MKTFFKIFGRLIIFILAFTFMFGISMGVYVFLANHPMVGSIIFIIFAILISFYFAIDILIDFEKRIKEIKEDKEKLNLIKKNQLGKI